MAELKLPGLSQDETAVLLPFDSILTGYVGSTAHNTYIPKEDEHGIDDKDILSVFVSPLRQYIGVSSYGKRDRGTIERKLYVWDSVAYDVRKYVHLLLKGNPNVLSLLWLRENQYIHIHPLGQELITNRHLFVSKQAYHSFVGYANGQLKRMEHSKCEGYMGEKRKRLVEKYGFDVKNAAHLIRILRMGIEFLREGHLHVFRDDSEMLKDIKRGEWSLEKVKEEAERLFRRAEDAYDKSHLPPSPSSEDAEKLVMWIISKWHQLSSVSSLSYPRLGL
jgi:predicted nucleotidyltransferase